MESSRGSVPTLLDTATHHRPESRFMLSAVGKLTAFVGAVATSALVYPIVKETASSSVQLPELPFNEQAQYAIVHMGDALAATGGVGVSAAIGLTVANAVARRTKSDNGRSGMIHGFAARGYEVEGRKWLSPLRRYIAPILIAGAGMSAGFNAISDEIENGPTRPIAAAFTQGFGKDITDPNKTNLIVAYEQANPMSDAYVPHNTGIDITERAKKLGIKITPFSVVRTALTYEENGKEKSKTVLGMGLPVVKGDALYAKPETCDQVYPVIADKLLPAGITKGKISGRPVNIVDRTKEPTSAIERLTVFMSTDAAGCLNPTIGKAPTGEFLFTNFTSGILVNDNEARAKKLLEGIDEQLVVISADRYAQNSASFWEKNVKPLTNIISLLGVMLASFATAKNLTQRLSSGKKKIAGLMLNGEKMGTFRQIEALRASRQILGSTALGAAVAGGINTVAPSVVFGLQAHISPKDALVGAGVVTIGSILGLMKTRTRRAFNKLIKVEEAM